VSDKSFGFSELDWCSFEFFFGEREQADFLLNVSSYLTTEQGIDFHLLAYALIT